MSSASKIFLDQNKDGVEIPLSIVMKTLKEGLNNIIFNSYEVNEVSKNELSRLPLILNKSTIKSFIYEPFAFGIGDNFGDSITAKFNIFCKLKEEGDFPRDKFKFQAPHAKIYHQRRHLECRTNLNCDAQNYIPNINPLKNKFMILSIEDDVVGQLIMKDLAVHLQNVLQTEVYYQRTDLNDEITPINPTTKKRTIKP